MWDHVLGHIPLEEDRWRRFDDFYINSLRSMDLQIANLLQELDALGLADRTMIVFTSDHGEMAGAHGSTERAVRIRRKHSHPARQSAHPDVQGGQTCKGPDEPRRHSADAAGAGRRLFQCRKGDFAGRDLPGKNLMPILGNPSAADAHTAREGVLFTYSALVDQRSGSVRRGRSRDSRRARARRVAKASRVPPGLKEAGSVRTAFDGRDKFSRYFASRRPQQARRDLTELYQANDVELFDLQTDPRKRRIWPPSGRRTEI